MLDNDKDKVVNTSALDSKNLIKEQKKSVSSFIAEINYKGEQYTMEVTKNSKLERYALLQEDTGVEEVDVDDLDFDLEFFDSSFDLEDDDEELSSNPSNEEVLSAWKDMYAQDEEEEIDYSSSYGTEDEDGFTSEPKLKTEEVQSLNVQTEYIEPDEVSTHWKSKKVIYDYFRFSPKKDNLVKYSYGDGDKLSDLSILVNNLLNFPRDDKTYKGSTYSTENEESVSIKTYSHGNEYLTTYSKIDTSEIVKYTYKNEDLDLEIDYYVYNFNKNKSLIEPNVILPNIPYKKETLDAGSTKDKKQFKFSKHIKTLVLPKVAQFEKFLNLSYIKDADYEIVDTTNKLIDFTEKYLLPCGNDTVIGYDAETTGLNSRKWLRSPDVCVTHSFSWDDGKSMIVPIRMKNRKNVPVEECYEILKPVFETKNILAHNGAADVRFLLPDNINLNLVEDTMHLIRIIIPFIVKPEQSLGLNRGLDSLCKKAFGYDMIDLDKYVFKPAGVDFDFSLLNDEYLIHYGCPDTDLMRRLWKGLRPKLDPKREYAYKQLVAYSKAVAILGSYPGIGVDTEKMVSARNSAVNTVNKVQSLIYELTGEPRETFKLSAPKQVSNYIFNKMGAPTGMAKRTDKGELSVDKSVMEALASQKLSTPSNIFKESSDIVDEDGDLIVNHNDLNMLKYPFCRLHRIQADKTKDITAFFNGILNNSVDGVYYPDFRVAQTDTYRDTDRVQITKKTIKYFLGAYSDEYAFISMDYATEEFRITASLSTDQKLIDMLKDRESDPHTMVAAELYNMEPSQVDKSIRDPVKSCNFGIIYGMKVNRLAKQLYRTEHPTPEQLSATQELYDTYIYKRAEMLAPLEESRQHVRDTGWVENAIGAWMLYPQVIDIDDYYSQVFDFTNTNIPEPHFNYEKKAKNMGMLMNRAGNFPIQSLAAFQLKDATIKFYNLLKEHDLLDKVFVPLYVHDEIGVIYHKTVDPYLLLSLIHKAYYSNMDYINKPLDKVAPLFIGVGFGTSWGNAKNDKAELPVQLQEELIDEFNRGVSPKLSPKEDHAAHFSKRIKEFLCRRITELFQDMVDSKHFKRNEMLHRINESLFIGKKMDEIFGTNKTKEVTDKDGKKVKKKYIDVDMYIELISNHTGIPLEDFLIEDGEEVVREEKKKDDGIIEFFFNPQLHERVTVHDTYIRVDVRGLPNSVLKSLLAYLWTLHNPEHNYHNKQVSLLLSSVNGIYDTRLVDGLAILGIPADFPDVLESIINSGKYETGSVKGFGTAEPQPPLLLVDNKNNYIVFDVGSAQKFDERLIGELSSLINVYKTNSAIIPYRVWLLNNGQYIPTDFYIDGVPTNLLRDMENLYNKYNYTYKM